jgi:ADP-ribosyl-[dinitrogen reductase] hydrolase
MKTKIIDTFLGMAVGDALGVPVEFLSRAEIAKNPVVSMREYGTHYQPAGTWSDDSSMAFCLTESLCKGYDIENIAGNFVQWYAESFWTPHGEVFDMGIATRQAIKKIQQGITPMECGGTDEQSNGNGSLMRILPLIFYIKDFLLENRFQMVKEVSSITHAHIRSVLSCFIYTEFAIELLNGTEKTQAYKNMQQTVNSFLKTTMEANTVIQAEIPQFDRILTNDISQYPENEIKSTGYVLATLEASLWCFLTTNNYMTATLKAVNLGDDTDTTGCVTGGLAGLYYGSQKIPEIWLCVLAKKDAIVNLADRFANSLEK